MEGVRAGINYFIRSLKGLVKAQKLPFNLMTFEDKAMIQRDPYGVVLVLGAWNYPFELSLQPMVGAIAAGNCVILKPSEVSQKSAATIARLIPKYLDNVSIF